eukprot:3320350-Alexandrium_andersonii.AAC.1
MDSAQPPDASCTLQAPVSVRARGLHVVLAGAAKVVHMLAAVPFCSIRQVCTGWRTPPRLIGDPSQHPHNGRGSMGEASHNDFSDSE